MNWQEITEEAEVDQLKEASKNHPVLIFKHSTRCSISATSLDRLERNWKEAEMVNIKPFYLDLIKYRGVSNKIQNIFHIEHQSPQILVIKDGQCVYNASHIEINYKDIREWVS
ncbi:MAG TPA: bacillithiol system redox-active protein YtxJ [Cytophagaceae bacterium]|jgi:bacillithiol system protein YtxJ|nr:bacillithiol system redox-active protein YtxJ [Cytophagaceae bacterium]